MEPLAGKADLPVKTLADTVRTLTLFFRGAVKKNLRPEQLDDDLSNFGMLCDTESLPLSSAKFSSLFEIQGIDEERRAYFQNAWKQQFLAVSRSLLAQTLAVYPLLDMDWRFGGLAYLARICKRLTAAAAAAAAEIAI